MGSLGELRDRYRLNAIAPMGSNLYANCMQLASSLLQKLHDSMAPRVLSLSESQPSVRLAILFSGGLDCTILAMLAHHLLPLSETIDLINVAFENPRKSAYLNATEQVSDPYMICADRINSRNTFKQLVELTGYKRRWRLLEVGEKHVSSI